MVMMINEEGDRAGPFNGGGGGGDQEQQQQQHDSYDKDFPPGYRFQPTDQELIKVYLFRKVNAFRLPPNRFADVNIYSCNPWELAAAYETYGENIHYFFTPREKKYPNGHRPNRAAGVGYWKACGADKPIRDEITNKKIGSKRSLVFYRGKPSAKDKAEKTNWIMHEYTLKKPDEVEEKVERKKGTSSSSGSYSTSTASSRKNRKNKKLCPDLGNPKNKQLDEFVLCKLYLKLDKSTKDTGYPDDDPCDEDITQENNIDFAAPSPSMATSTSTSVPTNYHQMHQYPSTSMVVSVAAGVGEMVPVNRHHPYHIHQTVVAAHVDYQYSLTSMVNASATQEEMIPFTNCKYSDNINPSSAVSASANHHYHDDYQSSLTSMVNAPATQEEMMPFTNCKYSDNINPSSAVSSSTNHHYHDEDVWGMLREWNDIGSAGWINDDNIDSQSNFLGSTGFSVPDIKADIGPK